MSDHDIEAPSGWGSASNDCGGVLVHSPGRTEDILLTGEEAAGVGLNLIWNAIDEMDSAQLRKLGSQLYSYANIADDYAKALNHCPRCGDGPYAEESR